MPGPSILNCRHCRSRFQSILSGLTRKTSFSVHLMSRSSVDTSHCNTLASYATLLSILRCKKKAGRNVSTTSHISASRYTKTRMWSRLLQNWSTSDTDLFCRKERNSPIPARPYYPGLTAISLTGPPKSSRKAFASDLRAGPKGRLPQPVDAQLRFVVPSPA